MCGLDHCSGSELDVDGAAIAILQGCTTSVRHNMKLGTAVRGCGASFVDLNLADVEGNAGMIVQHRRRRGRLSRSYTEKEARGRQGHDRVEVGILCDRSSSTERQTSEQT